MFTGKNHKEKHFKLQVEFNYNLDGQKLELPEDTSTGLPITCKMNHDFPPIYCHFLVQCWSLKANNSLFKVALSSKVQFGNIQHFNPHQETLPTTPNTPELASETLFLKPLEGQNEQLGVVLVIQRREGNGCEFATFQPMDLVEWRWPAGCFGTKIRVRWCPPTVFRGGLRGLGIFVGIPWMEMESDIHATFWMPRYINCMNLACHHLHHVIFKKVHKYLFSPQ